MSLVSRTRALVFLVVVPFGCTVEDPPSDPDTTGSESESSGNDESSDDGGFFCGDGFRSEGEECDTLDFGAVTCESLGAGTGGALTCTPQCTIDATGCTECGNGILENNEQCDGFNLDGQTCESLGEGSGRLGCLQCGFDTSGCGPVCGDGSVQEGETCDGDDLAGASCESLFGQGGTLACTPECVYDDSDCDSCGDMRIDRGEECDTLQMDGKGLWYTCEELLGDSWSGDVVCGDDCTVDSSMCFECGNGVIEGLEECDANELDGMTCMDLGEPDGVLGCSKTCAFDVSGCGA